jgi:hypothetical protein
MYTELSAKAERHTQQCVVQHVGMVTCVAWLLSHGQLAGGA